MAAFTWASMAAAQPDIELELQSCVTGSPPLRVSSGAAQAWLQAADRQQFHDAAQARFAMYQRGGLAPAKVLMLRRGRHWQYVTLADLGTSGLCFTGVFAADRFDFTAAWIAKYKPRVGESDD